MFFLLSFFFSQLVACSSYSFGSLFFLQREEKQVLGQYALAAEIDAILSDPIFVSSTTGIKIIRLRDEVVLYERNNQRLFHPASTMKLLTAGTALEVLGSEFRYTTDLAILPGTINDGIVTGDIYLKGSGDPSLQLSDLETLVQKLKERGISRVKGNIVCDASFFDTISHGKGWMLDDRDSKFSVPLSALSVNNNSVEFTVAPSVQAGDPALISIFPETSFVSFSDYTRTLNSDSSAKQSLSVSRKASSYDNFFEIRGTLYKGSKKKIIYRSVFDPALFTGNLFYELCLSMGIEIKGKVLKGRAPLKVETIVSHDSAQLSVLLEELNKESNNLYAENILKTIGVYAFGQPGTSNNGLKQIRQYLSRMGISDQNYNLSDGSGVSRYGLVTPDVLSSFLLIMYQDLTFRYDFISSLSVAGVDGTLKKRMRNFSTLGKVHAKSGSLQGVSTLAGYTRTNDGDVLGFVFFMEHLAGPKLPYIYAQDKICALLRRYREKEFKWHSLWGVKDEEVFDQIY